MKPFVRAVIQFLRREDGPTAVEYAVMLAMIITVCTVAIGNIGATVSGDFTKASGAFSSKASTTPSNNGNRGQGNSGNGNGNGG